MALAAVQPLLLADVLPHRRLVEAHRAHAVPDGPEVQAHRPPLAQQLPVDPHRALALEEAHRVRHAELGRDREAQVDVVRHRVPLDRVDPPLLAQVAEDPPDLPPLLAVQRLATVLWRRTPRDTCSPTGRGP